MSVALSGNDTVMINTRVLADLADGDAVLLTFPNDMTNMKTGKNGNTIYGLNEQGRQVEASVRVIRGSADDKFMNNLLTQQKSNFAGFPLLTGQFTKKIGDGQGGISEDNYVLSGGMFMRAPDAKMNVEGDSEQSVSVYKMKFTAAPRTIG